MELEFRQFLLWRNPTSPATTIPKKENWNRAKTKRMRGGEARAERNGRSGGTRSQRVLERMLSRDGIRRGAYDYISHYHFLGACHIHYLTLF